MLLVLGKTWLTASETGDFLGSDVTPGMVRTWAHDGKIRGYRVGRHTYYALDDLRETEHSTRTSTRGNKRTHALMGMGATV